MISLARYRALLRRPDLAAAVGASVVGRLPVGMAMIAILLFIQHAQQSFSRAGLAAAMYVAGIGVFAPAIGRLIDRFGPAPLLIAGACAYPIAMGALVVAVKADAGAAWIAGLAFLAGIALPPVPTCIRALLRRLLHDPEEIQAAYSLDSVLMETVFIVGPGLVSLFVAVGWSAGAVGCAAACAAFGAVLFARTAAVRSWQPRPQAQRRPALLGLRGLPTVLGVTLCFSAGFGLFEVAVAAVATRNGAPAAAGLILAAASLGSAAGALVYGSRTWSLAVTGQYKVALAAMAAGLVLIAPIERLSVFAVVAVLAGAPMSTVLAVQSVLIAGIAPREALAECFTWASTSLLAGVSLGIAAGGLLLEVAAPAVTFLAAAAATTAGLIIATLSLR